MLDVRSQACVNTGLVRPAWAERLSPQLDKRITPFVVLVINCILYVHGWWSIIPSGRAVKMKMKV